ncbi:hypothetical protein [Nocardioides mangrovi]|uniref:DUF4115 domain-containing protein n=1 Tax=Nocardioides mangrovi TaxID=2874580 RepID=A0ABS7UCM7_9ACTN|nr:hypothetical protein [Nocardioides mangrovi]MBZ5738637.1 hypothetical protein [Nocardioides mangrovi]
MTDPVNDPVDDELRDRLRAADPARDLPVEEPARVEALLQDVMATELTSENRATGTRGRGTLTWLVAAAALVVIAGIGVFALVGHGDDPAAPPTAADAQTVTDLAVPSASAADGRCMVPDAEVLRGLPVAFDGTVTAVTDQMVTLDVTHWYAGTETDLARVVAPAEELSQLLVSVDFRAGQRYLVAAQGGKVAVCGLSGPYSPQLAVLYDEAFPG